MAPRERYAVLMHRAATGDTMAGALLILGGWWPGDPESDADIAKVVDHAKSLGYAA